jgi:hypothetical protein
MQGRIGTIERALQLAGTGMFRTVTQVSNVLRAEGYSAVDGQLSGGGIRRQLRALMLPNTPDAAAAPIQAAMVSPDR